jgi:hypothetical protein
MAKGLFWRQFSALFVKNSIVLWKHPWVSAVNSKMLTGGLSFLIAEHTAMFYYACCVWDLSGCRSVVLAET